MIGDYGKVEYPEPDACLCRGMGYYYVMDAAAPVYVPFADVRWLFQRRITCSTHGVTEEDKRIAAEEMGGILL